MFICCYLTDNCRGCRRYVHCCVWLLTFAEGGPQLIGSVHHPDEADERWEPSLKHVVVKKTSQGNYHLAPARTLNPNEDIYFTTETRCIKCVACNHFHTYTKETPKQRNNQLCGGPLVSRDVHCSVGALTLPGCRSCMHTCWLILRQCLCPSLEGVGNLNNNNKALDLQDSTTWRINKEKRRPVQEHFYFKDGAKSRFRFY